MRKIQSLFMRNYEGDGQVRDEIVPGSEWVANGEGVATRKWDGTCCLVRDGKLYKRCDLPLKREWVNKKKRGYTGDTQGGSLGDGTIRGWRSLASSGLLGGG